MSKYFGDVNALKSLDLYVPQKSIFAFLGPNGAEKSMCWMRTAVAFKSWPITGFKMNSLPGNSCYLSSKAVVEATSLSAMWPTMVKSIQRACIHFKPQIIQFPLVFEMQHRHLRKRSSRKRILKTIVWHSYRLREAKLSQEPNTICEKSQTFSIRIQDGWHKSHQAWFRHLTVLQPFGKIVRLRFLKPSTTISQT